MNTRVPKLLCFVLFVGTLGAAAQDVGPTETIKVDTRLVSVPVIVSDRNGRYVPNLTAGDFALFQDGKQQKIEFFGATEEPLTIAVLIDTSHSTRFVLDDIKDSAVSFVKLLGKNDKAMVVAFDYDIHVLSQLTSDHDQLNRAIRSAKIGEFLGTQLRDAVYKTISRSFRDLPGRKAIILLTDGKDATSNISPPDMFYALQETDTLIYPIMFATGEPGIRYIFMPRRNARINIVRQEPANLPPTLKLAMPATRQNQRARQFLEKMTELTAGRFFEMDYGNLNKTFEAILNELRYQYRLGFYPPEEAGENVLHELSVKIARAETSVRARSSYRVKSK